MAQAECNRLAGYPLDQLERMAVGILHERDHELAVQKWVRASVVSCTGSQGMAVRRLDIIGPKGHGCPMSLCYGCNAMAFRSRLRQRESESEATQYHLDFDGVVVRGAERLSKAELGIEGGCPLAVPDKEDDWGSLNLMVAAALQPPSRSGWATPSRRTS